MYVDSSERLIGKANVQEVKENIEKALELNPDDGASWHVLGMWHTGVGTDPYQHHQIFRNCIHLSEKRLANQSDGFCARLGVRVAKGVKPQLYDEGRP
jgi:hypothetical protein